MSMFPHTVTLYCITTETDPDTLTDRTASQITVLKGVLLDASKGRSIRGEQPVSADDVTLYVPFDVKAEDGITGEERSLTVEPDGRTFFVKGEVIEPDADAQSLEQKYGHVYSVTKVRELDFGGLPHWVWSPFGKRTTDSSIEYDWSEDTSQDILGNTWTTMKKPVLTQSFDPWDLDGGDEAQRLIYQKAIVEQDAQALTNMDVMIAHFYSGSKEAAFAERYASCMVKPASLGGEGGGNIGMPTDVTYGGERTVGTVSKSAGGAVTFTAGSSTGVEL